MKRFVLVALVVGLVVGVDDPNKDKKGAKGLEGTWIVVSVTMDGKEDEKGKGDKVIIKGENLTIQTEGKDRNATVQIDPKKKTIDITLIERGRVGKTMKGIYQLKGDELKVCRSQSGEERPKDLTAGKGSGNVLVVLKRAKDKGDKIEKKLAPVVGKVTLNGQPLAKATVEFVPLDKGGQRAMGTTDENGDYKLTTGGKKEGVVPGKYRVVISKKVGGKSILPARYGPGGKDTITFEVPRGGTDKANLDLKSP
jgi:uncharacterized protein (TIGR03067 family)